LYTCGGVIGTAEGRIFVTPGGDLVGDEDVGVGDIYIGDGLTVQEGKLPSNTN